MKVLVCGDRNWTNYNIIHRELSKLPKGTVIVHGAARGADSIAGYVAKRLGFGVVEYPAKWDLYGRSAGPIRNYEMLINENPDLVMAFHSDIPSSQGTKNMVLIAKNAGIEVVIIDS